MTLYGTRVTLTRAKMRRGASASMPSTHSRNHARSGNRDQRRNARLEGAVRVVRGDRRVASGPAVPPEHRTLFYSSLPCIALNHRRRQMLVWTMAQCFFNVEWELGLQRQGHADYTTIIFCRSMSCTLLLYDLRHTVSPKRRSRMRAIVALQYESCRDFLVQHQQAESFPCSNIF